VNVLKIQLLAQHNITLNLSETLIDHIAAVGYDERMGARPLSRKIDEIIKVPLSKRILFERLKNVTVNADYLDEAVTFVTDATVETLNEPL
jgi:ATP-dependent Clp protease ATP-binding subunit ClpA